jgi:type VI secretion system secreted protein VgrG
MTMPVIRAGEKADFTFEVGGIDADVLRVLRFHGSEGMSELFEYEIEMVSKEATVGFDDVVGKPAQMTWATGDGVRHIHGIVSHFEQTGRSKHVTHYGARLVPKLWSLTLQSRCRIFQDMATPKILEQVLKTGGIPADQFKLSLKASYPARKYCVQYCESDFDFASRLMEEEGIWYYFKHDDSTCVMVIGDDKSTPETITGEAEIPFREGESGLVRQDHVGRFRFGRSMRTGAVTLNEYDFKKPKTSLKVENKADEDSHLAAYEYPGEYPDAGLGKRLVQMRLEAQRAERDLGLGDSDCRRFEAGHRFTLSEHSLDELNQEYLLVRIEHKGEQMQGGVADAGSTGLELSYRASFQCIPAKVPWRPARETARPRIDGLQTARVTTPSGEEIHCDEHGRVKVKFHWDLDGPNDDKSSCWVRVVQGWSSAGWGAIFIPRRDDEVVIEFLEGDPDRPLITGRVHNGLNPVPYELPGGKTRSTIKTMSTPGGGGFNELRFEDAKGSEEIYLQGEKDWNILIKNDRTKTIGRDETTHVKNNRTETVDKEESITIHGGRTEAVDKDEKITISGNRTESVTKDETITISGNRTESVAKDETITITGNRSETVSKDEDITIKGSRTESVAKDENVAISGKRGVSVEKSETVTIREKFSQTIGKDAVIDVGAKLTIVAKDEIVLKTGSASITLKSGGDILISAGGKMDLKASGNLTLKGSQIAEN